ncbi:hypothetical protein D3C84_959310 [compost metagenome]
MALAARQRVSDRGLQIRPIALEQGQAQLLDLGPVHVRTGRVAQFGQFITQRHELAEAARITARAYTHFKQRRHPASLPLQVHGRQVVLPLQVTHQHSALGRQGGTER